MILTVLKRGQQWDSTARLFVVSSSAFERVATNFMKVVSDHLYEKRLQRVEEKWTMLRCRLESELFQSSECTRNPTDVTFHRRNGRTAHVSEVKFYSLENAN